MGLNRICAKTGVTAAADVNITKEGALIASSEIGQIKLFYYFVCEIPQTSELYFKLWAIWENYLQNFIKILFYMQ